MPMVVEVMGVLGRAGAGSGWPENGKKVAKKFNKNHATQGKSKSWLTGGGSLG